MQLAYAKVAIRQNDRVVGLKHSFRGSSMLYLELII